MPRRSTRTRKRLNEDSEKVQTTLKEPTRKKAKIEKKAKVEKTEMVMEEEEEDDFDFDSLMDLVSPSKNKSSGGRSKKAFADSTQDDFIKMLQDIQNEDVALQKARTSYQNAEDKPGLSLDDLNESVEIETSTQPTFQLHPPILFDTKVDASAAYDRYNLKKVVQRNNITIHDLVGKHPYFIGADTLIISLPTQEDLVASGYMQTLLRQIPANSIPPFIFDWLFNIICFSQNRTIPGTAFRTLASLISPQPFSVEIDTLSPDLSIIDSFDESAECSSWSISFSTFVDILILQGANPEKFGREREKKESNEEDSDEDMDGSDDEGEEEKEKEPLFSPLRRHQLDLFLQLTGLTITSSKYKKDPSDLHQFLKVCAMLLLDPVGQHTQGLEKKTERGNRKMQEMGKRGGRVLRKY